MAVPVLETVMIILAVICQVSGYLRVCYYTNWSQYRPGDGKYTPDKIDPNLCTHIIFAFGKLEGNRLVPFEWNDDNTEWSKGMYAKVNDLKKQNPQLKTLLATGGWNAGSKPFSDMVATRTNRSEFVTSTIEFLRQRDFDGLDIDWEYPAKRGGRPEDKARLVLLLQELNSAFNQDALGTGRDRLLLTAAVPAGKSNIDAGYDVASVARLLDFINLMSYDFHGSWESKTGHNSPLYARQSEIGDDATLNMDWAANYWLQRGAPREKLIIGIGLYGRSFTLTSPADSKMGAPAKGAGLAGKFTREAGFMAYYEVCKELQNGATRIWDPEQRVPYIVKGDMWVGYDDQQSIKEKIEWLKLSGFGGVMVWSLALDDFSGKFCNNGPYPLMHVINRELGTLASSNRFQDISNILSVMPSVPPTQPVVPAPAPPTQPRTTSVSRSGSRVIDNSARRRNQVSVSDFVRRIKTPPTRFQLFDVAPLEAVVNKGPDIRPINAEESNTNLATDQNMSPEVMSVIPMEITNALLSPQGSSVSDAIPLNIGPDIGSVSFTNIFSSPASDVSSATNAGTGKNLPPPVIVPLGVPLSEVSSASGTDQNLLASELSQSANIFSSAINSDKIQPNSPDIIQSSNSAGAGSFLSPPITLEEVNNFITGVPVGPGPKGPNVISLFDRDTPFPAKPSKSSSMGTSELSGLSVLNLMNSSMSEGVPVIKDKAESQTRSTPVPLALSDSELLNALDQRNTAILRKVIGERPRSFRVTRRRLGGSSRTPFIRPVLPASVRRAIVTISGDSRQRGGMRPRNAFVINPRSRRPISVMARSSGIRNSRRRTGNNVLSNRLNSRLPSMRNSNSMPRPRTQRPIELVASIVGNQPLTPSQAIALRLRLNRDIRIVPVTRSSR